MRFLRNIFSIARWEYTTRVKSRTFIFFTVFLPLLVLLLFTFPIQLKKSGQQDKVKLIGLINLNEIKIAEQIQQHINQNYILTSGSPGYIFMPVSSDESPEFTRLYKQYQTIRTRKDSISLIYDQIMQARTNYYKNSSIKEKDYLLGKTYQELINAREIKSRLEEEYNLIRAKVDSIHLKESTRIADSLLQNDIINAYIVLPEDFERNVKLQYYSLNSDDLSEARRIQKIITEVLIKTKLNEFGIETQVVDQWLRPVRLEKVNIRKGLIKKDEFLQFYVTVIGVTFLLISIFTSGGLLLSSVFKEKNDQTIEFLVSKTSSVQVLLGKITGLGALGITQIALWSGLASMLLYFNFFPLAGIMYFHPVYYFYFLIIYLLGYLFYAAFLIIVATRISSENEIQRINTLGAVLVFMFILLLFVIPDEFEPRILNIILYIPFFTPFLIIVRAIKIGIKTVQEMYILGAVYLLITQVLFIWAYRSFKNLLVKPVDRHQIFKSG